MRKAGLLLFITALLFSTSAVAVVYTTTSSGPWTGCPFWSPGCPPDPLPAGDTILIQHSMNFNTDYVVEGVIIIESSGALTGGGSQLEIDGDGKLINNGSIDINDLRVRPNASYYNNGYAHYNDEIHIDGYICNTDTLDLGNGMRLHGGTLECGGTVLSCAGVIELEEKDGNDPWITNQNMCCPSDSTSPTFDIQDGAIDSPNVVICAPFPLPIDLLMFDAYPVPGSDNGKDSRVRTEWITAAEINNDYFTIERSQHGITFEEIASLPGAGNSNMQLNYEYYDSQPYRGTSYYRLKQTDYNGTSSYSDLRVVRIEELNSITIYPVPADREVVIAISTGKEMNADVAIYNNLGQVVRTIQQQLEKGTTILHTDVSMFARGVYAVKLTGSDGSHMEKKLLIR